MHDYQHTHTRTRAHAKNKSKTPSVSEHSYSTTAVVSMMGMEGGTWFLLYCCINSLLLVAVTLAGKMLWTTLYKLFSVTKLLPSPVPKLLLLEHQ